MYVYVYLSKTDKYKVQSIMQFTPKQFWAILVQKLNIRNFVGVSEPSNV